MANEPGVFGRLSPVFKLFGRDLWVWIYWLLSTSNLFFNSKSSASFWWINDSTELKSGLVSKSGSFIDLFYDLIAAVIPSNDQ